MISESFRRAVDTGISTGEWLDLAAWLGDHSAYTFKSGYNADDGPFDEVVFCGLLALFHESFFLGSNQAADVLLTFECDWSQLTEGQRDRLLPALVESYGDFVDFLPRFVISELLGEYYPGEVGLSALVQLKATVAGERRALLPMGFERIVRKCPDRHIAQCAYDDMMLMADDPCEGVRGEVGESLDRIAGDDQHGIMTPA